MSTPLKNMRKTIILIIFIFLWNIKSVFSDILEIPFSCWPQELKSKFTETNRKLDLTAAERTEDSWGYVLSKGDSYVIYTYQLADEEDFQIIQKIVSDIELEHRKN